MSDSLHELLELIEDNKEHMNSSVYLNLVTGLSEMYKRTNGNFTTDFRQMYLYLKKELEELHRFLDDEAGHSSLHWTYRNGVGYGFEKTGTSWRKAVIETPTTEGYEIQYYNENGIIDTYVYLDKNRRRHRTDGPATIAYASQSGKPLFEEWYEHGLIRRIKVYNENGELKEEKEYETDDAITQTKTYKNGKLIEREWRKDGNLHRDGIKPARIVYTHNDPDSDRVDSHHGYIYHDGAFIGEMEWTEGEDPEHYRMVRIKRDPPFHELVTYYYDDGTPREKQFTRTNGVEVEQEFYQNGVLKSECLSKGIKTISIKCYKEDGTLESVS